MFLRAEFLVAFAAGVRLVKQVQTVLQSQDAAYGIVDARHADFTLSDQLLQQDAEVHAVGVHRHVNAGVDGQSDGVLLVLGHVFAAEKVVDVGPVGHNHTVPLQVLLEPFRQVLVTGVNGHSVDAARVDHDGQRARLDSGLEGLEVLLAEHLWRDVGRRTVLTGKGGSVGKVVLYAGGHVVASQVVRVVALIALNLGLSHTGVYDGVLAEALPDAWPSRVAAQVEHGIVNPRAVACTALVGRYLSPAESQLRIERGRQVDGLREERACLRIGDTMILVQSVDIGDADVLHRLLLNQAYPLLPLLDGSGFRARRVQDGANLVFADDGVEHRLVQYPLALAVADSHLAHHVEV